MRSLLCCVLTVTAPFAASAASLNVNAASVVGPDRPGRNGVNCGHDIFWTSSAPNYRADIVAGKIQVLRIPAYPNPVRPNNTIEDLDRKVAQIINAGAQPLFVQYINSNPTADATFLSQLLKLDGTAGGTIATNVARLVNRYKAPPYNLTQQYWEIGNEPDIDVNYQVSSAQEYITIFQAVHNQLVASGLRGNVLLCGPAVSWEYGFGGFRDEIMNAFLPACKNQVDIVTRHIYAGIYSWETPVTDTAENLLNANIETAHFNSAQTGSRGEGALLAKMNSVGVPATVGTGVTEMNLTKTVNEYRHTITQGLWFLLSHHYASYNPRNWLALGYGPFERYNNLLAYYKPDKSRSFTFWAAYIQGVLTGDQILAQTSDDPRLVVTGSKDSNFVYVRVINRGVSDLTAAVTLANASVGAPTVFKFSSTLAPDVGTSTTLGTNFNYTFPAMTAHVFRFPINGAPGPVTPPPPPAAAIIDTDFITPPPGMLSYSNGVYPPNVTGGNLQLTSAVVPNSAAAVVFAGQALPSPTARVQARFGFRVNGNAEGFVFGAYSATPGTVGNSGPALGYHGQSNYLWGVKVDNVPPEIAILTGAPNAQVDGYATQAVPSYAGLNMFAVVDYDGGAGTVRVRLYEGASDTGTLRGDVTNRLSIPAGLAAGTVFGFTAATGNTMQTTLIQNLLVTADYETIVDNTAATGVTKTGSWISSTARPGYYGSDFIHDNNGPKGGKSVQFTPNLPAAGTYKVYGRWTTDPNRASNVPVDISHVMGTTRVTVDQRMNGGVWVLLGTYTFNAGTTGSVLISNAATNGYVIADAVRFVKE